MAKDLFYLPSYKNVGALFEKIASAKAPDAFTQKYLADTLGLKSNGDRALINMLKKMGFLDASGRPTNQYNFLKNKEMAPVVIAKGLRSAFAPLFEANESAHKLNMEQLKGLVSQISGAEQKIASSIAYTFSAIAKSASFDLNPDLGNEPNGDEENKDVDTKEAAPYRKPMGSDKSPLRPDFHFNIQIHLPANATEETYLNIFGALRRTFS